ADQLMENPPQTASGGHDFAYLYALCGARAEALSAIREAIDLGVVPQLLAQEDEFISLREDPEFQALTQGVGAD
ncbi:MAG: hypothetical protein P8Y44_13010, partial [Acidobacteriota bacterium]